MRRGWFSNDDIPMSILSRLPAKKLHSLKYVSKEWYKLISTRSFISLQLEANKEPLAGYFFQEIFEYVDADDKDSISFIPVEAGGVFRDILNFLPKSIVILSSNNGLLCCRSCLPNSESTVLYICNPLNKQYLSVPFPNLSRNCSVSLAFDPFQNLNDSSEFKLVSVSDVKIREGNSCFVFDIYSSKTESWRRSDERCQCNHRLIKNKGVFVGGNLYWLSNGYQILMFDPQTEVSLLVLPPIPPTELNSVIPEMCIGESDDKLHYVIISEDGLQLWVLEDHFLPEWCIKFSVSLEELEKSNSDVLFEIQKKVASRCRDDPAWLDPLAFKDGTILLRAFGNVYSYDFENGRMKKLCDCESLGPKSMFSPIVVPYSMSLVPLC